MRLFSSVLKITEFGGDRIEVHNLTIVIKLDSVRRRIKSCTVFLWDLILQSYVP